MWSFLSGLGLGGAACALDVDLRPSECGTSRFQGLEGVQKQMPLVHFPLPLQTPCPAGRGVAGAEVPLPRCERGAGYGLFRVGSSYCRHQNGGEAKKLSSSAVLGSLHLQVALYSQNDGFELQEEIYCPGFGANLRFES